MKKEEYICRLRVYTQVHYIPSRVYTRVICRFTMYQVAYICRFAIYQVGYTRRLYMQVHIYKEAYTHGISDQKSRMHMHTLSCMENCIHVGRLIFGSVVFRPMVLNLGISSEVLNPGIGSLILVLNGFGPWY